MPGREDESKKWMSLWLHYHCIDDQMLQGMEGVDLTLKFETSFDKLMHEALVLRGAHIDGKGHEYNLRFNKKWRK